MKAFLLTASTAPQRTFVRLSGRFSCLRVFLNVCSVSKNTFSTRWAECGFTFRFVIPIFLNATQSSTEKQRLQAYIYFGCSKKGYDIAVHKSQAKTGGRQYRSQRKVKAEKKERGQAVTGYYDKFCWVYFTKYQSKS